MNINYCNMGATRETDDQTITFYLILFIKYNNIFLIQYSFSLSMMFLRDQFSTAIDICKLSCNSTKTPAYSGSKLNSST